MAYLVHGCARPSFLLSVFLGVRVADIGISLLDPHVCGSGCCGFFVPCPWGGLSVAAPSWWWPTLPRRLGVVIDSTSGFFFWWVSWDGWSWRLCLTHPTHEAVCPVAAGPAFGLGGFLLIWVGCAVWRGSQAVVANTTTGWGLLPTVGSPFFCSLSAVVVVLVSPSLPFWGGGSCRPCWGECGGPSPGLAGFSLFGFFSLRYGGVTGIPPPAFLGGGELMPLPWGGCGGASF